MIRHHPTLADQHFDAEARALARAQQDGREAEPEARFWCLWCGAASATGAVCDTCRLELASTRKAQRWADRETSRPTGCQVPARLSR